MKDLSKDVQEYMLRRFGDGSEYERMVRAAEERMPRGDSHASGMRMRRLCHDGTERLAYYRAHGLADCPDYPGGDSKFADDVVSGRERDEDVWADGPLKAEDAYVVKAMADGKFEYGDDFSMFAMRPEVKLAYYENARSRGIFFASFPYPGGFSMFRHDVLSGRYARDMRALCRGAG